MASHLALGPAREQVLERARRLPAETVRLAEARGRTLAGDVFARHHLPPFDNSAMDGFALRSADTAGATASNPVVLTLAGESRAGTPERRALEAGEIAKISTGAALPDGADCVLRVEDAGRPDEAHVEVAYELAPGHDVRPAGDDVRAGERVVAAGAVIGAGEIAMLASVGSGTVECARRPRVAIVTTGDELVEPGGTLEHGQIFDSNSAMLVALVEACGAELVSLDTAVADEQTPAERAIAAALAGDGAPPDVLIACGGVSVGEHDHVKPALAAAGVGEIFWQVAMRPGHPTYFGVREAAGGENATLVFGLPGNPVSAYATFHMFAAPALRALAGGERLPRTVTARLAEPLRKPPGHAQVLRCRLSDDGHGGLLAAPTSGNQRSHAISSLVGVHGLALIPAEVTDLAAGAPVAVELTRA
ncbi:MAG: molybdopterin molybdotransferase MoeA [Actinobacteria bacterium]|nr:molybdopterin molybdotransferase MoeA [Actinomycetota bacterium]